MAAQSRTMTILLTRPQAQSLEFARALKVHFSTPLSIIISPLLRAEFPRSVLPPTQFEAVIFTSQTAVEAARRISANGNSLPNRAFCVGEQTKRAAIGAGFHAVSADSNAAGLLDLIKSMEVSGPLIHLRGEISKGDVAESLISAGIETVEVVVYRQVAQSLDDDAVGILGQSEPVFIPLFSPRSAKRFLSEIKTKTILAPIYVATISQAVAQEAASLPAVALEIARSPNGDGMIRSLEVLFAMAPSP